MELHELLDEHEKLNKKREQEVRQRVNIFWDEVLDDLKNKFSEITNSSNKVNDSMSDLKTAFYAYIAFLIIALAINFCFLFYTVNNISKAGKDTEPVHAELAVIAKEPVKLASLKPSNFEEFVKHAKLDYYQFDTLLSEQSDLQIGLTTNTTSNIQSLYILIDNKYLVIDSVYDLNGNNISLANAEKAKAYTPAKPAKAENNDLNEAYNNIKTSNGYYQFDFDADKTIYAYYDLDCGYCQKTKVLFEEHKDLFSQHKLNVYWLPVAILSNDLEKVSDRLANTITPEQIAENTDDFNNLGVQGVPVFIWKEQDTVMGYVGAMQKKDLLDIFDSI